MTFRDYFDKHKYLRPKSQVTDIEELAEVEIDRQAEVEAGEQPLPEIDFQQAGQMMPGAEEIIIKEMVKLYNAELNSISVQLSALRSIYKKAYQMLEKMTDPKKMLDVLDGLYPSLPKDYIIVMLIQGDKFEKYFEDPAKHKAFAQGFCKRLQQRQTVKNLLSLKG